MILKKKQNKEHYLPNSQDMTLKKGKESKTTKRPAFVGSLGTRKKKKSFITAMTNALCNISVSCEKVGISRNCYYDWMKSDPLFKQNIDEVLEGDVDFAETMLKKNIREGKETSLIFFLKTKGKHRGYIESIDQQITGKEGGGIIIEVIDKRSQVDEKNTDNADIL